MLRVARIVVPGAAHPITQRGSNHHDVFFVAEDRRAYLESLRELGVRFGFRVEGYCLMSNHIYVAGVPAREESLAKAIGRTHFLYSLYVNRMHGRSGHLWQDRFYSCPMDATRLHNALCYVELNPVRAGMVKGPSKYEWSSAPAHCGKADANPLLDLPARRESMPPGEWVALLKKAARDKAAFAALRQSTHTGRPLGSDSSVSKVECLLGRRVRALPMGRQTGWRKTKTSVERANGC